MSLWISRLPIRPAYLALILVVLYYTVYFPGPLTLLLLAFLLWRLFWETSRADSLKALVLLICCGCYFAGQRYLAERADAAAPDQVSQLQLIPDTISINGDSLSFRAQSGGQLYQVFYQLQSESEQKAFQQLTQPILLTVEAEVTEAEGQRNFRGFDYQRYLETQGIYKLVSVSAIRSIQPAVNRNPLDRLSQWRRTALVFIRSHFPEPMRHYMTGLLFGYLDKDFAEMSDLYSSLGIIHLFALSGMQVGFFIGKFRWFLLRLGFRQETVNLIQLPVSVIYAGLTGFAPSVIRSLIQKNLGSQGLAGLDNLAVTVLISFAVMPNFLLTAGGILSFAYAFILTMTSSSDIQGLRRVIKESGTLALGILPLLIWHFSVFQPASIPLTFLLSFIFDLILLPLLSLVFLLSPLWKMAELNSLFLGLEAAVRSLSGWIAKPLVFGQPQIWTLAALLILLGLAYDARQRKKRLFGLFCCLGLLLALTKHPLTNEITVVDIGQGDSLLLRDSRGRTVLIDVGGRVTFGSKAAWQERQTTSNASRTLIPYLHSRGIGKIDQLVLTHTDTDHVGDLLEVADALTIGEIWVSPGSLSKPGFVRTLEQTGASVHVTAAGDQIPIFDSQLEVLYPRSTGDGGNNDSIVLYGQLLGTRFLFTGDLEEDGERDLLAAYPGLRADVLKAGHHGSKGSSSPDFLRQLAPKIALISAGKNNRYQHPHLETLDRFAQIGTQIYRTDQQGAIRFSGWSSWQIETVR